MTESANGANRLADSASPYLLQHANNPVGWYPWGDPAFDRARATDRPMFISIGYATCHWCHVMERESFENDSIADVLNKDFVPVKVDREEHPDVDHFYMTACTAGGRRGGWPLTILALPDGKPFYAATYLPPFGAGGRAGLMDVLQRISDLWDADRGAVEAAAADVTGLVRRLERPPDGSEAQIDAGAMSGLIERALGSLRSEYDGDRGGFGRAPKFPVFHRLRFLLAHAGDNGRRMALRTLRAMRAGGIWDHVGHGFHRYSTDRHWHLPHFEKMLCDQAMALAAFAEAWAVTGDPVFRDTVHQIADVLERDFRLEDGLMASAWDADSEGEEGRFYVWTRDELRSALEQESIAGAYASASVDGAGAGEPVASERLGFLEEFFAVRGEGNFVDESTGRPVRSNILDAGYGRPDPDLQVLIERFAPIRRTLLARRGMRVHPIRDEKRLTDWNGLYVAAAAVAGRLVESSTLIEAASRTAERLLDDMRRSDGSMNHRKFGDRVGVDGGVDDYAMPALACLELFQATGEPRWLRESDVLIEALLERFYDDEEGVLRISRRADIPVAQTRLQDEAYPSGSGIALYVMSGLCRILDRRRYADCLERILTAGRSKIAEWPAGHLTALGGVATSFGAGGEIVVAGSAGNPLGRIVRRSFTPLHVHVHAEDGNTADLVRMMPWLGSHLESVTAPTVFICTDRTCERPITDPVELRNRLLGPGLSGRTQAG